MVAGEFKQTLITNYIHVLDKVNKLIENNKILRNMLVRNTQEKKGDNVLLNQSAVLDSNSLLKCLYKCIEKNQKSSKYKHHNRF